MFTDLIKYVTHHSPTLPKFDAIAYEYITASNGIAAPRRGLRSSYEQRTVWMCVIIPVVQTPHGTVRGLYPLTTKITIKVQPMPTSLLQHILTDACLMRTDTGQLNEALYRFHYDGCRVRVDRPSQNTSPASVSASGDGGADVILEIHSHGNMRGIFRSTDNRDEQGFRIYGVIGRLDSDTPEIRLRTTLRVANTRWSVWSTLAYYTRCYIFRHQRVTLRRFGEKLKHGVRTHRT